MTETFWSKVKKGHALECWPWTASQKGKGYGQFWKDGKPRRAHRIVWEMVRGPIPKGKQVLHRCDNRLCMNPSHLFLGNNAANAADMAKKNRHGASKLSAEQVAEIIASSATNSELGRLYGVHRDTIWAIRVGHARWEMTGLRKARRHLPPPRAGRGW